MRIMYSARETMTGHRLTVTVFVVLLLFLTVAIIMIERTPHILP